MALSDITKSEGKIADDPHQSPRYNTTDLTTDLAQAVRQLIELTDKINKFRANIATATLSNVGIASVFAVFILIASPKLLSVTSSTLIFACLCSIFVTLYAALMTIGFDPSRRAGNDLYSEISDTLQSEISFSESDIRRPVLRYLKWWLRASDMPLVPGPYGPAVYLLLNILATVSIFAIAFTHK